MHTNGHARTHTHTHISNDVVCYISSLHLRVADLFFAVFYIILLCNWKYLVLELHVNNIICLIHDIINAVFTRFTNLLH